MVRVPKSHSSRMEDSGEEPPRLGDNKYTKYVLGGLMQEICRDQL